MAGAGANWDFISFFLTIKSMLYLQWTFCSLFIYLFWLLWLKHAAMSFGCPPCPAFPPVIPQVSLHSPSSALLSLALIRVVGHVESCLLGATVFAEVSALVVSGPWWQHTLPWPPVRHTSNFSSRSADPFSMTAWSLHRHLAWPSDPEQAFLLRSRIMLISLVIIIHLSCDKTQHSEKPTLNIQTPTAEK